MKARIMVMVVALLIFLMIDYYVFQAVLVVSKDWSPLWKNSARIGFWIPSLVAFAAVGWWALGDPYKMTHQFRTIVFTGLVGL
jgi:uncharacterized protein